MSPVERLVKYGTEVWSNVDFDQARKTECLCLNCQQLEDECCTAKDLFAICINHNLALMVTRCPRFELKSANKAEDK